MALFVVKCGLHIFIKCSSPELVKGDMSTLIHQMELTYVSYGEVCQDPRFAKLIFNRSSVICTSRSSVVKNEQTPTSTCNIPVAGTLQY